MLRTRITTMATMCVANGICSVVSMFKKCWGGNDFDYFVFNLREQYPNDVSYQLDAGGLPFIKRSILIDDEFQKCIALKIGDCVVEYTHKKVMSEKDFYEAVIYDFEKELNFGEIIGQARKGTLKAPTLVVLNNERERKENVIN